MMFDVAAMKAQCGALTLHCSTQIEGRIGEGLVIKGSAVYDSVACAYR